MGHLWRIGIKTMRRQGLVKGLEMKVLTRITIVAPCPLCGRERCRSTKSITITGDGMSDAVLMKVAEEAAKQLLAEQERLMEKIREAATRAGFGYGFFGGGLGGMSLMAMLFSMFGGGDFGDLFDDDEEHGEDGSANGEGVNQHNADGVQTGSESASTTDVPNPPASEDGVRSGDSTQPQG